MPADTGRSYWEKHAKRYDASTRFLSRPVPRMLELAVEASRGRAKALEVAAGTGLLTTAVAPVVESLIATDYATAMVDHLSARVREANLTNVVCQQADLYDMQFSPATFDAALAANVLHLVPDLEGALASLRRVLKPDGVLIIPTYLHAQTLTARVLARVLALTRFPASRRFTFDSFRHAISSAGFHITRSEIIPGPFPVGYVEAAPS